MMGGTDPIQIRAQFLRTGQIRAPFAMGGFALMPDEEFPATNSEHARHRARWRSADVKRAIEAAEKAGLDGYRVEIAPDGTISIVVGQPFEMASQGQLRAG